MPTTTQARETAETIARRHGIPTLEPRNMDALDFHELGVWTIRTMLTEAFDAGFALGSPDDPQTDRRESTPEYRARVGDFAESWTRLNAGDLCAAVQYAESRARCHPGGIYDDVLALLRRRADTLAAGREG